MKGRLPDFVCEEITKCLDRDREMVQRLREGGAMYGYHPEMQKTHEENAGILEQVIDQYGLPTLENSSQSVAEATFVIGQHAISRPRFMVRVFDLMCTQAEASKIHLAYLEDRIQFFRRLPQRFGTQFDYSENGLMEVWLLDGTWDEVNERRLQIGLYSMEEQVRRISEMPALELAVARERTRKQELWRKAVGWDFF